MLSDQRQSASRDQRALIHQHLGRSDAGGFGMTGTRGVLTDEGIFAVGMRTGTSRRRHDGGDGRLKMTRVTHLNGSPQRSPQRSTSTWQSSVRMIHGGISMQETEDGRLPQDHAE